MQLTAIVINLIALGALVASAIKDRRKTVQSLKVAGKSLLRIIPVMLIIIIVIGLFLGFVPPRTISSFLGEQSGAWGLLVSALLGAVMHIPALISYPLAASLLEGGAALYVVATFITTLTMIGIVTLPLEIAELGKKLALLRNGLSFMIAILIALAMWVVL